MYNMISQRTFLTCTKSSQILDFPFVQLKTSVVCKAGQKEPSKRKLNFIKAIASTTKKAKLGRKEDHEVPSEESTLP